MNFVTQLLADLRVRVAALFGRNALNSRLDEEIRFHIELREQRLRESGMTAEDARVRALREFGNRGVIQENTRENWRYGTMGISGPSEIHGESSENLSVCGIRPGVSRNRTRKSR